MPHVSSVSDPYTTPGNISKSGTIALANAELDDKAQNIPNTVGRQIIDLAEHHTTPHSRFTSAASSSRSRNGRALR